MIFLLTLNSSQTLSRQVQSSSYTSLNASAKLLAANCIAEKKKHKDYIIFPGRLCLKVSELCIQTYIRFIDEDLYIQIIYLVMDEASF